MCGIAGLWNLYPTSVDNRNTVNRMSSRLSHRGPDGFGEAVGTDWALGHARLSIIDLAGGKQPIWDDAGEVVVVGNNEIYNHLKLRKELEILGHRFTTHSDTEVLLHGWKAWGEQLFVKLEGMFAFAIVDKRTRQLILARDPFGIKPLHYTSLKQGLAFSSEIKSFLEIPEFRPELDREAAHLFMNFRYIPNEKTLFKNVFRFPPGSYALIRQGGITFKRYFSLEKETQDSPLSYDDSKEKLTFLIEEAAKSHLMADVEVGAYLSGGIDSSTLCYFARKHTNHLRTFCLGFGEPTDEINSAKTFAERIGTEHQSFLLSNRFLDQYQKILYHVEEPKINLLQGYAMAEKVSPLVKAVLSGLGGDELFAGYEHHDFFYLASQLKWAGGLTKKLPIEFLQKRINQSTWDHFFRAAEMGGHLNSPVQFYAISRNTFDHSWHLMNQIYANPNKEWKYLSSESLQPYFPRETKDLFKNFLLLEANTKLVNDFLLTEDRVSMAHGLETRVPFLDRNLATFSFSLPTSFKYQWGNRKRILRDIINPHLPPSLRTKKKWGFSINPVHHFELELRPFLKANLTQSKVEALGLFNWNWIKKILEEPVSPRKRWHYFTLWTMAGMQLWSEMFLENRADKFILSEAVSSRQGASQ